MTLTAARTLVAISDFRAGWPPEPACPPELYRDYWQHHDPEAIPHGATLERLRAETQVNGGYMERLPLACICAGLVDTAEKWHYTRHYQPGIGGKEQPLFGWRAFHLPDETTPFHSPDMLAYIRVHGAPHVLCVYGLGVSEAVLEACAESIKIYYSLDAPPLRVPPEVSRHFDLILVGGEWQRDEVLARHPDIACEILTLGPEFADPDTFHPLNVEKDYDLVYVACAQPYKRHDVLFNGMAQYRDQTGRNPRALCVVGYGHTRPELEQHARELGLQVDFVGPPGVSPDEVNALINRARVGVVAGEQDGCPAILTEYMLAGLPVLANADLCCGLRFINDQTGVAAPAEAWGEAIAHLLEHGDDYQPRAWALEHVTWPHSVAHLARALEAVSQQKKQMSVTGVF